MGTCCVFQNPHDDLEINSNHQPKMTNGILIDEILKNNTNSKLSSLIKLQAYSKGMITRKKIHIYESLRTISQESLNKNTTTSDIVIVIIKS
jgi:hypothetical protein